LDVAVAFANHASRDLDTIIDRMANEEFALEQAPANYPSNYSSAYSPGAPMSSAGWRRRFR